MSLSDSLYLSLTLFLCDSVFVLLCIYPIFHASAHEPVIMKVAEEEMCIKKMNISYFKSRKMRKTESHG